jgi:hypothetical protein
MPQSGIALTRRPLGTRGDSPPFTENSQHQLNACQMTFAVCLHSAWPFVHLASCAKKYYLSLYSSEKQTASVGRKEKLRVPLLYLVQSIHGDGRDRLFGLEDHAATISCQRVSSAHVVHTTPEHCLCHLHLKASQRIRRKKLQGIYAMVCGHCLDKWSSCCTSLHVVSIFSIAL